MVLERLHADLRCPSVLTSRLFWAQPPFLGWAEVRTYLEPGPHTPRAPRLLSLVLNHGNPTLPRSWQHGLRPLGPKTKAQSYPHHPPAEFTFRPREERQARAWFRALTAGPWARTRGWTEGAQQAFLRHARRLNQGPEAR